ncbi:DUF58 domain-containing protein [Thermodesulfobacteriota bacterium]
MKRAFYISFRRFYVINHWITGRFTPPGWLVLAGLPAAAAVGLDTNQTVAYMAFAFLLAIILVSMIWGILFRARFTVHRKLPPYATVNEPIVYRVVIKNETSKRQGGLFIQEDLEDPRPSYEEYLETPEPEEKTRNPFDRVVGYHRWVWLFYKKRAAKAREQTIPILPPWGEQEIRTEILPTRRGKIRFEGISIRCPDPFGLFRAFCIIPLPQSILVLPKRYPIPPIELPGTRRYQPGGVTMALSVGDSEEFISLRDYRPGDPLRRIHWKSWAKRDKPIVKEYQDEFFVRHALILDTFQTAAYSDVFEEAVSVAASFAYRIQTQESLLDLMFIGTEAYCFTVGRGLAQVDKMLELLASARTCGDKPFKTLSPLVHERASLLSGCVCVLLEWDEERKELISLLKGLRIPVLVLVIADDQVPDDLDPGPMADTPENLRILRIGKIREGLARL